MKPSLSIIEKIRLRAPKLPPQSEPIPESESSKGKSDSRWAHQDQAVLEFLKRRRGVLEMATGTGKTRTALKIVQQLIENNEIDNVIVSTEGLDLLAQWHKQVVPVVSKYKWVTLRHFGPHHERDTFLVDSKKTVFLTSNSSLHIALKGLGIGNLSKTLIIFDEVHRLGSPATRNNISSLLNSVGYRLGLSATPEREYDSDGNDFVERSVGPTIFKFDIGDAIKKKILTPFQYFPLKYQLTDEDRQALRNIAAQLQKLRASGAVINEEEFWIRMARVAKTSIAKIPVFTDFIRTRPGLLRRSIIFVETIEYGERVYDIVHRVRPDYHTYFAGDDSEILMRFARGELECLITCHRLSEGIDVRSTETVILFASARARLETIQRIGRCLRVDPQNPDKIANVIDFIREEDDDEDISRETADQEREAWLTELSKIRPENI